ncbi:hypothetical protein BsWGS_24314 [Bradybaena similaris]
MYCLLPLFALLAVTAAQGVGTPSHRIILDARLHSITLKIYQETLVHSKYGPDASVKLLFSIPFRPGVEAIINDPSSLQGQLDSILSEAKKHIPSAYFEWTSLHVYLTSGVRYLPVTDVENVIELFQQLLNENPNLNPFKFDPSKVQVLAGEDEAAASWLAGNYLLGSLGGNRFLNETVGVLDLGNTSTEISFVPDEPQYAEKYPLKFSKRRHELYVQNYLQYGSQSIYIKIHNVLLNRSLAGPETNNPCMLKDDVKQVKLSDGSTVTHKGSGDPRLCEEILAHIVKPNTGDECQPKPCALGRVYQPRVQEIPFIATVGFVYTPTALGVVDITKILYLDRLREAGQVYCKKTVSQVMAEYEKEPESASQDCLLSLYIPRLLIDAYGFQPDTRQIRLVPDVEGEPVDWALGMALQLREWEAS